VNLRRAALVTVKDLRLGPRSPVFLWAILLPLLLTFLITAVFGALFAPPPRLAVVDEGSSAVTEALLGADGLEVRVLADADELRRAVVEHEYDAGLLLPAGVDEALRSGEGSGLEFFVSGSSLASTRVVLGVMTIGLLREVAGQSPPVEVVVTRLGDEGYVPVEDRVLPLVVAYAVVIAGMFLPALSLVEERQRRTLDAVLVTPARMSEVLLGKALLGVLLALGMGLVTLAVNDAFAGQPLAMTLFLLVGAIMMAELGLILGCWARDSSTLFSAVKGGGILIFLPVVFILFPALPQWIPRLVPTHYFLTPIYEIATTGSALGDHFVDLLVGAAVCLALVPAVAVAGRRAERRSALTV
jgi:ABC-2 type transport system permease protein